MDSGEKPEQRDSSEVSSRIDLVNAAEESTVGDAARGACANGERELLANPILALAVVLICFVLLQVLTLFFSLFVGSSFALVPAFVIGGIVPIFLVTKFTTRSPRLFLRLLPPRPLPLIFSIGASFSLVILQYNLAGLIENLFPMPSWIQDFLINLTRVRNLPEFVKVASGVVIAAAIAEELLFRGLLQKSLETRWGRWPGILLTSVLFALLHDPWRFIPILLVALLFGYLVSKGNSIYYGMVAHAVTNATSVAGGNLFGIQAGRQMYIPISFIVLMIAVFAISIAGFVRSIEKEE